MSDLMIKISVVIPTLNEEKDIGKCIDYLILSFGVSHLTSSEWEINIIDSGSTDKTLDILKNINIDNINIYICHDKTIGEARYYGLKISRGIFVAFIDANTFVSKEWITVAVNTIRNKDFITGEEIIEVESSLNYLLNLSLLPDKKDKILNMNNSFVNRKKFLSCIDPPRRLIAGEDFYFSYLISEHFDIYFNNKLKVNHVRVSNFTEYVKKGFWYGRGWEDIFNSNVHKKEKSHEGTIIYFITLIFMSVLMNCILLLYCKISLSVSQLFPFIALNTLYVFYQSYRKKIKYRYFKLSLFQIVLMGCASLFFAYSFTVGYYINKIRRYIID